MHLSIPASDSHGMERPFLVVMRFLAFEPTFVYRASRSTPPQPRTPVTGIVR